MWTPLLFLIALQAPSSESVEPASDPSPQDRVAALRAHREGDRCLQSGDLWGAHNAFRRLEELDPGTPASAYGLACFAARAGKVEEAFSYLEEARKRGFSDAALARWDVDLASLHDSGFEAWCASLKSLEPPETSKLLPLALDHPQAVSLFSLDLDENGEFRVTGSAEGQLVLADMNPRGRRVEIESGETERVWRVAVAPDASHVAALWHSGVLKLWKTPLSSAGEPEKVAELAVFEKATRYCYPFGAMLKFSSSGDRLFASGGGYGTVLLDLEGEVLARLDPPGGNFFSVIAAWSRKGDRLFFARGKELLVLRAEDGAMTARFELPHEIECLAVDPDPGILWVGGGSNEIGRFELKGGSYARVAEPSGAQLHFEVPSIASIHRSCESDRLAYSTATSAFVEVLSTGADVIWTSDFLGGRMGEPVEVLLSPSGDWLWYAWKSGAICSAVVDLNTGQEARTPIWTRSPKLAGSRVLWLAGRGLGAFDAESGRELWHRIELQNGAHALIVHPGYFDGEGDCFEGLDANLRRRPRAGESIPVWDPLRHYDPKRVRAALDGVEVQPPSAY